MTHCTNCLFWDEETAEDNAEGQAICRYWTIYIERPQGVKRLCLVRTAGDEYCPRFCQKSVSKITDHILFSEASKN
jgi:hypothetical protein